MKPLSAIAAVVTLVLAVIAVATLILVKGRYDELLAVISLLLIALTVIFAAISAVTSPQAPLTRVVFGGIAVLFGLVGVCTVLISILQSPVPYQLQHFGLFFWFVVFMAGIAIPSVMTIALARNAVLLYGAYVLVMLMWLISFGLLYLDLFLTFYGTHR